MEEDEPLTRGGPMENGPLARAELVLFHTSLECNSQSTAVKLMYNKITSTGMTTLTQILKINTSITSITLWNQSLHDDDIVTLVEALQVNSTITEFNMVNVTLSSASIKLFVTFIASNSTISSLDLGGNTIRLTSHIRALADTLKLNTSLTSISLWNPNINAYDMSILADAFIINTSVLNLDLSSNVIKTTGVEALIDALKINTTIDTISVRNNCSFNSSVAVIESRDSVNIVNCPDKCIVQCLMVDYFYLLDSPHSTNGLTHGAAMMCLCAYRTQTLEPTLHGIAHSHTIVTVTHTNAFICNRHSAMSTKRAILLDRCIATHIGRSIGKPIMYLTRHTERGYTD